MDEKKLDGKTVVAKTFAFMLTFLWAYICSYIIAVFILFYVSFFSTIRFGDFDNLLDCQAIAAVFCLFNLGNSKLKKFFGFFFTYGGVIAFAGFSLFFCLINWIIGGKTPIQVIAFFSLFFLLVAFVLDYLSAKFSVVQAIRNFAIDFQPKPILQLLNHNRVKRTVKTKE